ncbi:hypothetical protein K402DRAFT_141157 [Aulographum hederae CBS 113979]|uniref:Uncharacterized protein n=1 Tax=Aulographum hederae CBS 113979 TaxID=1176131 RepID=A0A6G1GU33_9PEZI|nr:hypothetical protein K402DRAFT_141157 [Aulographum hederae CBS 113979]
MWVAVGVGVGVAGSTSLVAEPPLPFHHQHDNILQVVGLRCAECSCGTDGDMTRPSPFTVHADVDPDAPARRTDPTSTSPRWTVLTMLGILLNLAYLTIRPGAIWYVMLRNDSRIEISAMSGTLSLAADATANNIYLY